MVASLNSAVVISAVLNRQNGIDQSSVIFDLGFDALSIVSYNDCRLLNNAEGIKK